MVSIYPTVDEMRKATKSYFIEHHNDFYKSFKNNALWVGYYEAFVYSDVSLRNFYNLCIIFCKLMLR
jgi:hypothetical protein